MSQREHVPRNDLGGYDCPNCRVGNTWVGIEVRGDYDGVLYWECSFCTHRIHRWPKNHPLRVRAAKYVEGAA